MTRSVSLAAAALFAVFTIQVPATAQAASAQMSGARLSIGGGDQAESFYVDERHGRGYYDRRGRYYPGETYLRVRVVEDGETVLQEYFTKDDVASIVIMAQGGDDYIELNTDLPAGLFGGHGDDEIHGGPGSNYIDAGPGWVDTIYGHGGDDDLFCGDKWFLPGVMAPYTEMHGGAGHDTFIYRNADFLLMDDIMGPGWMIVPDYTYGIYHDDYPGMHRVSE